MDYDMELERIEEEIRRHDERRRKLVERRNRKLRQIREKQLKDKDAWTKRLLPLLDSALEDKFGELYWYSYSPESICERVTGIEAQDPGPVKDETSVSGNKKAGNTANPEKSLQAGEDTLLKEDQGNKTDN